LPSWWNTQKSPKNTKKHQKSTSKRQKITKNRSKSAKKTKKHLKNDPKSLTKRVFRRCFLALLVKLPHPVKQAQLEAPPPVELEKALPIQQPKMREDGAGCGGFPGLAANRRGWGVNWKMWGVKLRAGGKKNGRDWWGLEGVRLFTVFFFWSLVIFFFFLPDTIK
jgi:hypothetical protein